MWRPASSVAERLTGAAPWAWLPRMREVVVLRGDLPPVELLQNLSEALGRGADVDLVLAGRRTALLPKLLRRLDTGGALALPSATVGAVLFPALWLALFAARKRGKSWRYRPVVGAHEAVIEIR